MHTISALDTSLVIDLCFFQTTNLISKNVVKMYYNTKLVLLDLKMINLVDLQ